jgi:para-nitrobenzyl esterase
MHTKDSLKFLFIFLISLNLMALDDTFSVNTSSGTVIGTNNNKIVSWNDIPYAKPPIDDLRWKAPRKFNSDQIITPKSENSCIQEPSSLGGVNGNGDIVGTEDCLYLDIKAPIIRSDSDLLPVMFWIHGGGNTTGAKDIYDFGPMVKRHNVLVVTINYRLGPFGWFSHPAIQDVQLGIDKTSNFGTLDIIHALKWVQENIIFFGGDPNNVTIFGESAGGHNVLSLLVANQAKGLFHQAISQSGYTTSTDYDDAYFANNEDSLFTHTSDYIVSKLIKNEKEIPITKVNSLLKQLSADDVFKEYINKSNLEIPLLTNDGIVIPKKGLQESLKDPNILYKVPVIAGSNRDEVKLWIGSAEYFVKADFSFLGSIFGVPRIKLRNKDAFEAFNYYRSSTWQIRGVIEPLSSLNQAGNENTYAYRYDWDDHRRFFIANFKEIIGAAHATEIPLLTGNNNLVGEYGFLIYPRSLSKRFTSKNMMKLWTNFAKTGAPGRTTNNILWDKYTQNNSKLMILDKRKKLNFTNFSTNYSSLVKELNNDIRLSELEKCVVLYQMGAFIGNDIFDDIKTHSTFKCSRVKAISFLEKNASFIDY